jgi:hypothetical protein
MKVEFDFTLDDLVDVTERAGARSGVMRSLRSQGLILVCLTGAVVAFATVSGSTERRLFAATVAAVACALIYPFSMSRARKSRLRQYFREQFGGDGPYTCEVELTPAVLITAQAGTRAERAWSTVTAIRETPDSVDFAFKGSGSLVVRHRAFRSPEERSAFVQLARSYAPKGV